MGPVQQYAGEIKKQDILIKVYSGRDANFLLYNDDGETYAYEHGEFCLVEFVWDEKENTVLYKTMHGDKDEYYNSFTYEIV